jgi:hypothetical protein
MTEGCRIIDVGAGKGQDINWYNNKRMV